MLWKYKLTWIITTALWFLLHISAFQWTIKSRVKIEIWMRRIFISCLNSILLRSSIIFWIQLNMRQISKKVLLVKILMCFVCQEVITICLLELCWFYSHSILLVLTYRFLYRNILSSRHNSIQFCQFNFLSFILVLDSSNPSL